VKKTARKTEKRARAEEGPAQPVQSVHHAGQQSGRFHWYVIAIWAIAFGIRLASVWQSRSSPFFETLLGDARGYDAWAQRIAEGDWMGQGVFYQAPLYPYFLGVIYSIAGRDLLLVRICQAMIGAAGCALLALAGRRLHSERVGLIAGFGLAIYAPAIFFDGLLQKSVLDLFFVSLVLWLFSGIVDDPAKRRRWFWLGLALGVLALTRENALLLMVPILFWRLMQPDVSWQSRALRSSLLAFALGLSLALIPVAVRNRLVGGEWHLTTSQFGPNFYLGNNPIADGTAGALREGRGSVEYERQDATELAEAAEGRSLTAREVSNFWARQAFAFIRANPWEWVKLEARKLALLANRSELVDTESQESYEEWSTVLRMAGRVAHFGFLAPLALLGIVAGRREWRRVWPFYAMAATYAMTVLMFFVSARYRLPLVPFLMLFAAMAPSLLPDFIRAGGPIRVGVTAIAVIGLTILANLPLWPAGLMRAVTENNLGNVLQSDKRFLDAELHYKRAIRIRHDYIPAYVNLGDVLVALNRPEEAIDAYKRASDFASTDVDLERRLGIALLRAGSALLRAGRPVDAISYFQQTLALGQHSAELYLNLTAALVAANRREEAIAAFAEALQRHPDNSDLRFRFGTLLLELGRFPEAIVQFRAGLGTSPQTPEAHGNLGAALAASGRTEEAILEFEEALRLKPDLASARRNLEIARQEIKKRG
jgi:tetratricopeptide (TPR) repeat protein